MDGVSFQTQVAFQTNGGGAPIVLRQTRGKVTKGGTGIFFVQTTEDIADGSIDYGLGCGLDGGGAIVHCNVQKLAAFVWQITTSKVSGGADATTEAPSWKGSGVLSENAAAVFGYVRDGNGVVQANARPIQYPLPIATASLKLSIEVTNNSLTGAGGGGVTTFTIYKNGLVTLNTITYNPGEVGLKTLTVALAFAAGDTFDLRAETPGDDGAHQIDFGASFHFTNPITPAALTPVDTTGATISLTLKRVDPM